MHLNRHLLKEDIQMIKRSYKKMLNVITYEGNANQNLNEVSPPTSQNGHHQKNLQINAGECVEKREPSYTVGRNVNW